ncbi:MAG: response regulator [Myxococcota bacterium]
MNGTPKLLLIDDDADLHRIYGAYLENEGIEVLYATTAAAGAKMLQNHSFSVILLDLEMPGAAGVEAVALLQEACAYQLPPVILMTASHDWSTISACINAGVRKVVNKPFTGPQLLARLQAELGTRGWRPS